MFNIFFIGFTFLKYDDIELNIYDFPEKFYSFERLFNAIPIFFYYIFIFKFSKRSKNETNLKRIIKITFILSGFILPVNLLFDVIWPGKIALLYITLPLATISIAANIWLSITFINDEFVSFKYIGIGQFVFLFFIFISLILYSFQNIQTYLNNPHKIFIIGLLFELNFFYFALIQAIYEENNSVNLRNLSLLKHNHNLEKSALRAQMNPHFIFNVLNSIQNFIFKNEKELAMEYLGKFAKLVRLNLNASIEEKVLLEDEIVLLDNYLNLERLRLDEKFDYEFKLDQSIDLNNTFIPPMLIQPFVENAVIHGMKNIGNNGKIEVKFLKKEKYLLVIINDNGSFNDGNLENANPHHNSVGISITKKRLELINKSTESNFTIKHLEKGTTVQISINL